MSAIGIFALGLFAAISSACAAPTSTDQLDGCYSLNVAAFDPPVGADSIYYTPPSSFRLMNDTSRDGWRKIETLDPHPDMHIAVGSWQNSAGDSIRLLWTDGTTGVRIEALLSGDSLRGIATSVSDIVVPESMRPKAAVTGSRIACPTGQPKRVGSETLLHVTILGTKTDPRIAYTREAIAHWNAELARTGRHVRLVADSVRANTVDDELLRAASGEAVRGRGPATDTLRSKISDVPGAIVIILSQTDLISFGLAWSSQTTGIVVLRRSDIPPLSMPNTVRNVVAHELGHVLGLRHNRDVTKLMCGRPAPCRPAAFASDTAYFFPLTPRDENLLRNRWPGVR